MDADTAAKGMHSPPEPPSPRTEFNARLTSAAGMILFVLLAVQGVTILEIHRLLTYHYVVGFLILGPLALKLASTGYRFVRYYTGDPDYGRAGPPRPLLRLLAPLLVASTLGVFLTGVALAFVRPQHGSLLVETHKASFIVWFGCTTVHVLAYLNRAVRHVLSDITRQTARRMRTRRLALLLASIAMGVALAVPAASWAHPWVHDAVAKRDR